MNILVPSPAFAGTHLPRVTLPRRATGEPVLGPEAASFLALDVRNYVRMREPDTPAPRPAPLRPESGGATTASVLVNTCNHARFIEDCIESLLVQTVLPDEIIVYDDGSTDDTVARLRRYGHRITLIEGRRLSLSSYLCQANAVQTAFGRSSGRLIFLLDGDDRFKRDKIARYLTVFAANPDLALIQSPMEKIDEDGRSLGSNLEPRKHVAEPLREIYRRQDVDLFYPTSSLAFSRSYLECVLPMDFSDGLPLWMDTRLSITAAYFGRVITLPDTLSEWRRHTASVSLHWRRSRRLQVRQTLMRTRVFNSFCRRYGLRTISPWRNRRFYLQLLRLTLPERAYSIFYHHVRPRVSRAAP